MSYAIEEIEGIGEAFKKALASVGITNTVHLLGKCATLKGRAEVAKATGLTEALLLKWANMADLMRIPGIGPGYAQLLEAAGVDTVKELKTRNAKTLTKALREENGRTKVRKVKRLSAEDKIQAWIDAAKAMSPTVSH